MQQQQWRNHQSIDRSVAYAAPRANQHSVSFLRFRDWWRNPSLLLYHYVTYYKVHLSVFVVLSFVFAGIIQATESDIAFINAWFTAVSALCVTGISSVFHMHVFYCRVVDVCGIIFFLFFFQVSLLLILQR